MELLVRCPGFVVFVVALFVMGPIDCCRARRRYRRIVRMTGIDRGRVVDSKLDCGALVTNGLSLVTLWPGERGAVFDTVSGGIRGAGFSESRHYPGGPPNPLIFELREGEYLRFIQVRLHACGEPLGRSGIPVPAGETGVTFQLR